VPVLAPHDTPLSREAAASGLEVVHLPRHRKYFDFTSAGLLAGTLKRLGIGTFFVFHRDDLDVAAWARFVGNRRLKLVYQQQMRLGVSRRDPIHALRYRAYNAWIAPLEYLRDEVLAMTTVPARKIHVIPLGIDCGYYAGVRASRAEARKFFGVREDATLFGIIGRIEPGKGQAFLVRALKALRERAEGGGGAEVLIVGDVTIDPGRGKTLRAGSADGGNGGETASTGSDHADELRALAASLGLSAVVHFHPFIGDTRLFFAAVDACVMATAHETYGMVTLEAMASGVPVIGTDATGTREILGGGKLGLLYPAWDEEAFLLHARRVVAGDVPEEMVREAGRVVRERYSHDTECDLITELLHRLELQPPHGAA